MSSEELSVYLTRGLEGKDENIDLLSDLFEQTQTVTVETADPALDLISFAQDCTGFWVINANNGCKETPRTPLNEWRQEEFSNSLGLYPSHPSIFYEPMPSSSEGVNDTETPPFIVDPDPEQPFSDHANSTVQSMHIASTSPDNTVSVQNEPMVSVHSAARTEYPGDRYGFTMDKNIAGFIYLLPSSAYPDALHHQEYNIGIILHSEWRDKGVAEKALYSALDLAFSQQNVHRVQAQLIDCYKNAKALTLFTRMGFSHEGTRRQGFRCPLTGERKDVTTLALLVTDWVMYVRDRVHAFQSAPKSLWDILFARHQREREELLRWEDKGPPRSSSLETIRSTAATPTPGVPKELDTSDSEADLASEDNRSLVERPKRKLFEIGDGMPADAGDAYDASSSEYESEYESAAEGSPTKKMKDRRGDPNSVGKSAGPFNIDANLGSPGGGPCVPATMGGGQHSRTTDQSPHSTNTNKEREVVPMLPIEKPSGRNRKKLDVHSRSSSLSSDSRKGSVATVPASEPISDFESEDGGYTTSSSIDSSSPSGWELVGSDDELMPGSPPF